MDEQPEEERDPVFTLVYASAATREMTPEDLAEILAAARKNNRPAGVTGMLLYHEGSFLQALEGDRAVVEALYERIEEDPRHSDAMILFRGDVEERVFERWSMGFYRAADARIPPGVNEFLQRGFKRPRDEEGHVARKILEQFREGRWRRGVDVGE
ncbi:MAG: BLUF domain-containing protein [Myxococcota bacterium]